MQPGTDALAVELARRVRCDLTVWGPGQRQPGRGSADGVHASADDWITACRNANGIDVGQPGRTLANRDILRITSTEASYK